MKLKLALLLFLSLLTSCATQPPTVSPVGREHQLTHLCIENNPRAVASNIVVKTVKERAERLGITTEVYSYTPPSTCANLVRYTSVVGNKDSIRYLGRGMSSEGWHIKELRLSVIREDKHIGQIDLHLDADDTMTTLQSKLEPLVDQLLSNSR